MVPLKFPEEVNKLIDLNVRLFFKYSLSESTTIYSSLYCSTQNSFSTNWSKKDFSVKCTTGYLKCEF